MEVRCSVWSYNSSTHDIEPVPAAQNVIRRIVMNRAFELHTGAIDTTPHDGQHTHGIKLEDTEYTERIQKFYFLLYFIMGKYLFLMQKSVSDIENLNPLYTEIRFSLGYIQRYRETQLMNSSTHLLSTKAEPILINNPTDQTAWPHTSNEARVLKCCEVASTILNLTMHLLRSPRIYIMDVLH